MTHSPPAPSRAAKRFARWSKGYTARELAELLGVDPSYISHLRAGRYTPSLVVAVRIQVASRGSEVGEIFPHEWVRPSTRKASPKPVKGQGQAA